MIAAKRKIVVTNRVHDDVLARLSASFKVEANTLAEPWSADQLIECARDAEAIMAFMPDRIDVEILDACPRLLIVAGALKGYDNFDRVACTERGIWLTIVPDLLTEPTAELTIGLMIGVGRNIAAGDRFIRDGLFRGWRPHLYGTGLAGSVVGIIGMGAVGRAIAERLQGFNATILYSDFQRLHVNEEVVLGAKYATQQQLLRESDFVVLATHLMQETKHMIDEETLLQMKPGSFLINPGRGSLVDEAAVSNALESRHLSGYAADVFEMEDWAHKNRPSTIDQGLLQQSDRTLLTPHIGSAVKENRLQIEMTAATNILECLAGKKPPDAVNNPGSNARRPYA